jgi:hypothetical protein
VYLDFDGNTGPVGWCGTAGTIITQVFSIDGDFTTYSASELSVIDSVYKRMAEDFAPFNISVTTILPSDFNNKHALRIAIGAQSGGINWSGVGGVGCVGSFAGGSASDNVVFVHSTNLGNNNKNIAMASSHEAGHAFGLQHQDNPPCGGYHAGGTYNGENKGPIMGAPYSATREIWWQGFEGCGTQNDMAIIANATNGFGYRADDVSNLFSTPRRLRNVAGSLNGGFGVLHQTTDIDIFTYGAPGGNTSITLSPAALGPNADLILEFYHESGGVPVLLATSDPAGNVFNASVNMVTPPGKFYLVVKSDGDYGEVGQYTLTGSLPFNPSPFPGLDELDRGGLGMDTSGPTFSDDHSVPAQPYLIVDDSLPKADDRLAATIRLAKSAPATTSSSAVAITGANQKPIAVVDDTTGQTVVTAPTTSNARVLVRTAQASADALLGGDVFDVLA